MEFYVKKQIVQLFSQLRFKLKPKLLLNSAMQSIFDNGANEKKLLKNSDLHLAHNLVLSPVMPKTAVEDNMFGFLFDIDGVFVRGRSVIPEAKEAIKLLVDRHGRWRVPAVFVTNAGNTLKNKKAEALSKLFSCQVHPDQVVMSHTPLTMFTWFHSKRVLVCGQGPVKEIAASLGFTNVVSMDELMSQYPQLDACDHNRKKAAPCAFESYNKRIEAIVVFGEPVHWERSLQLLLDVLMTNGQPYNYLTDPLSRVGSSQPLSRPFDTGMERRERRPSSTIAPHVPILACNMDLVWMSEAPLPRLANGSFLHCLETLYEKLTGGRRLLYTALVGKPSELTYHYAEARLNEIATAGGGSACAPSPVRRIYCIGDNPQTDIYGANLYNRHLTSIQESQLARLNQSAFSTAVNNEESEEVGMATGRAECCESILVMTGVFQDKKTNPSSQQQDQFSLNHNHRDFMASPQLCVPNHTVANIEQAVRYVFDKQGFVV